MVRLLLTFLFILPAVPMVISQAYAANYTFNQTDWQTGVTANNHNHTNEQSSPGAWTEYTSSSPSIKTSVAGGITLNATNGSVTETTNADFNAGTGSSVTVASNSVTLATIPGRLGQWHLNANEGVEVENNTSGLVGMWHIDGAIAGISTSDTISDSQTNVTANDGTASNANASGMTYVAGKLNNAINFDGTDDYADLGNSTDLQFSTTFTLEAWIKPSTIAAGAYEILDKGYNKAWSFRQNDSRLFMYMYYGGSPTAVASASGTITVNTWQHVAFTWDKNAGADNGILYHNGVVVGTLTQASSPTDNTSNVIMGKNFSASIEYFQGLMDEVAIYNTVLSPATILEHYNRGIANDSTVNNNDGAIIGPVSTTGTGNFNEALSFDGIDDYVGFDTLLDSPPADGAVSMWFRLDTDANGRLFTKANDDTPGAIDLIDIYYSSSTKVVTVRKFNNGASVILSTPTISTGVWYFLTVTWGSNGFNIYLDGSPAAASDPDTTAWSAGTLRDAVVGAYNYLGTNVQFFPGVIDELTVYNGTITDSDVDDLYNSSNGCETCYYSSGTLTSQYIDLGQNSDLTTLSWGETLPAGTDLTFQIRSATTQAGLSGATWYGPTGTGDYYTTSAGETINSTHDGDRWVQYKATLTTTDNSSTPILDDITINYQFYPIGQTDNNDNGLVGLWHMDNALGNILTSDTVPDSQTNVSANNGTASNANATGMAYLVGTLSNAINFDGTDDYVNITDTDNLSFGDGSTDTPLSVEAWINSSDISNWHSIIGKWDAFVNKDEWMMYQSNTGKIRFILRDSSTGGQIQYETVAALSASQWYHIAGTYDGSGIVSGIKIYINGVEQSYTDASSGTYTATENTDQDVTISKYVNAGGADVFWMGSIDEATVYNTELSASTILDHYNKGYYLISSPYDTGNSANVISSIDWGESLPAGTDAQFQLRTAPDSGGSPGTWSAWLGPTSATDYYTDETGGETINATHTDGSNDQWVQYRALLTTSDPTKTPTLTNFNLNYSYGASGPLKGSIMIVD